MVLTGIRKIEIVAQPAPALHPPTVVLLGIVGAGICGSDLHYYTQGRIGDQVVRFPFCVGHECSAVVADVGKQVTRFKPGDRIVVDPSVSCGVCDQCRVGHRPDRQRHPQARLYDHAPVQPGPDGQGFRTAGRLSRRHHQGHGGYGVTSPPIHCRFT